MKCLKEYPCNLAERHIIRMVIFESNGCILTLAVKDAKEYDEGKTLQTKISSKILKNTTKLNERTLNIELGNLQ